MERQGMWCRCLIGLEARKKHSRTQTFKHNPAYLGEQESSPDARQEMPGRRRAACIRGAKEQRAGHNKGSGRGTSAGGEEGQRQHNTQAQAAKAAEWV